jgi:hypothetical protein
MLTWVKVRPVSVAFSVGVTEVMLTVPPVAKYASTPEPLLGSTSVSTKTQRPQLARFVSAPVR